MPTSTAFDTSTSPRRRWHPKATPYRLLVLGTTIGVGTAKALAAQEGDQGASTTFEWVSGVVIFLILHSMRTYDESPKHPPPLLGWLFHVDCLDFIWRFISFLRIPRPSYLSEPETIPRSNQDEKEHTSNATPVTLYRLLVSFTTAAFGCTKAIMTYTGHSTGATWVDWTVSVVITSILFIIGLYENNTIGMWHAFFVPDYSTETRYTSAILAVSTAIFVWLATCVWMISLMTDSPYSAFLSTDTAPVLVADLAPLAVLREQIFSACFILFMLFMITASLLSGVLGITAIMHSSELPKWKEVADRITGQNSAWGQGYERLEAPGRRLSRRVAFHIALFTTFLFGCAVFLAFWVVSVAANIVEGRYVYQQLHNPHPPADRTLDPTIQAGQGTGYLVFLGLTILFQSGGAAATGVLMWIVANKLLLPPLWRYRSHDPDWDRALFL